jgi:two-component system chemotaxis response regulator CheY
MAKRLLILMDNEPVTCRTLALDLTDAGYDVETATDSEEALEKLRLESFDLLITGEGPQGKGGKVVEGFRRAQPAAKVVLMTTDGAEAVGVVDDSRAWVKKPFDLEDFRSVVRQLLNPEKTGGKAM